MVMDELCVAQSIHEEAERDYYLGCHGPRFTVDGIVDGHRNMWLVVSGDAEDTLGIV